MKKWMLLILLLFAVFAGSIIWAEQTLSPLRAQTETAWEAADAAILRRTELVPALTAQTGRYTSESQDAAHAAEEARQRTMRLPWRGRVTMNRPGSIIKSFRHFPETVWASSSDFIRPRISGFSGREKQNK